MHHIAPCSHAFPFAPAAAVALLLAAPACVQAQQNLFVSGQDLQGNGVVHEYSPTGADLGTFASVGPGAAVGLAVTGSGDLFTADGDNTIHEFSPTNADLGTFVSTGTMRPFFLAFGSPAATPEPGSLALAVGALVPGASLLYRRRRKPAAK